FRQNAGDYTVVPGAQYQWARYQDGFFDVLTPQPSSAYAGWGQPQRMNHLGAIAGYRELANNSGSSAVIYDPASGWQDLNALVTPEWNLVKATGINDAGQVVGYGTLGSTENVAFRLDTATHEIINLGHLPAYPDPSLHMIANAINSQGHVVGALYDQWPTNPVRAFIFTDGSD